MVIKPLFTILDDADTMGNDIIHVISDDYNKSLGHSLIDAKNDADAIAIFLKEYQSSPETLRSYAKEVERLLLWCHYVGQKNISSLRRDDLQTYQQFLKKPTPKKDWCGPSIGRLKKDDSINSRWRPFVKGLGDSTIRKTLSILDSFFNYLVKTNYLIGNPLAVDKKRKKRLSPKQSIVDRYLELDEIHAVIDAVTEKIQTTKDLSKRFQYIRSRYLVLLLFYTGMRISEAANHRMGNFIERESVWFLRVIGKGKKTREIPVPDALLAVLAEFREAIGLASHEPRYRERTPLIPMQNLKQSISTRRVDQIIREAFSLGALAFDKNKPRKASKLRAASAHWLRHSYVTYLLESGAPLKVAQENAGHNDVGTTMHYQHVAQVDRHSATRTLSLTKQDVERS
jgi:site-specific recombinase XerD